MREGQQLGTQHAAVVMILFGLVFLFVFCTQAAGTTLGWDWSVLASDVRVLRMAVLGPSGREWPDSLNVFDTVWRERQV